MYEGAKAHRSLQKNNVSIYKDYIGEITLSTEILYQNIVYIIEGRADGAFTDDNKVFIDEIKTTVVPINFINEDFNITHWAQAKCYAYIYAEKNNLTEISVQMTYYNLDNGETKRFIKSFEFSELKQFVLELIEKYSVWANFTNEWRKLRDKSIKEMEFPFPSYRKGQRKLAVYTYKAIDLGKKLFAQAPTGIGKTISTLFPAVKAMGEEKIEKIFYLTAKTITRQAAEEAFQMMRSGKLRFKTITLTAKDKICFKESTLCYPERCEYAKGHYDRINAAIFDVISNCDYFSRTSIEEYAGKHKVCPFELSLDLSLWSDCVICDYNYIFDPRVYLRRFFNENKEDYVFIIDEAHNLVDRAREMFSAELSKTKFLEIKKDYKELSKPLGKVLNSINKYMLECKSNCGEQDYFITAEKPKDLVKILIKYTKICESLIKENRELSVDNEFLSQYFETLNFIQISDLYNDSYITFIEKKHNDLTIKLFCLDPSFHLREAFQRGNSAIMFSATLTPIEYFKDLLAGENEDMVVDIESPFDRNNLCLITADHVSTKFKNRQKSITNIVDLIGNFVGTKTGNYIVYFPSYKYMNEIYEEFTEQYPDIVTIEQEPFMTEDIREAFLLSFKEDPQKTMVAFCVLGGLFSEGIDLKGSRLIGAIIIGVGLPQLSVQQDIIKDYFNHKNGLGYEYAYMFPGMNKVLQAAGRVIRSEKDRGAILLVDERFGHQSYKRLFPKHWYHNKIIRDNTKIKAILNDFWGINN